MKKLLIPLNAIMFLYSFDGLALTASEAFQQGKTLATQEKDITKQKGYIDDAPNKIPGYTSSRQEEGLFNGASLTGSAISKKQGCATNPQQDGKVENHQECEAVNFLAGRPSTKAKSVFTDLSSDPAVVANINASQNLQSVLNQFGYSNTTTTSSCTNKSITNPAQYIEDTCIEGRPLEEQSCTYGRNVVIDANNNYKCNETVNAYETFDCEKSYECPNGGNINGTQCVISNGISLVPNENISAVRDVTNDINFIIEVRYLLHNERTAHLHNGVQVVWNVYSCQYTSYIRNQFLSSYRPIPLPAGVEEPLSLEECLSEDFFMQLLRSVNQGTSYQNTYPATFSNGCKALELRVQ